MSLMIRICYDYQALFNNPLEVLGVGRVAKTYVCIHRLEGCLGLSLIGASPLLNRRQDEGFAFPLASLPLP